MTKIPPNPPIRARQFLGQEPSAASGLHDLGKQIGLSSRARPTKEQMMLSMAVTAAARSSCLRHQVGAVITDLELTNVLAIGYNGPPKRDQNSCPAGALVGRCGCIHAETNALIKAPWHVQRQVMFVTLTPCEACARLILNSRIVKLYYLEEYRDLKGLKLIQAGGIGVHKLSVDGV